MYLSVSKLSYCPKGDSSLIRAALDEDRKADLRSSHFKVGQTQHPMITHSQTAFGRPRTSLTLRQGPPATQPWTLGDGSKGGCFTTSNMANYRWVQPSPLNDL